MPLPYRDLLPVGATSVRPGWHDLPDGVRATVAAREGCAVESVRPTGAGYTPGFAARVDLADGRRVFVKAADDATRQPFANAYRREAEVVRALPDAVPAPRVRWSADVDGWALVAFDHVDGRPPRRPWEPDELDGALALVTGLAGLLGAAGADVPAFADEFGFLPGLWDDVDEPIVREHRDEAAALAARATDIAPGRLVTCHTDVRDDNLLVDAEGRWWVCDWNGLCTGPRLFDGLAVLTSARGDGHDAEALLARHRGADGPTEAEVDEQLALLAGYYFQRSGESHLPTSPYLRLHQRWYAEHTWSWLCARRGWKHGPSGDLGRDDGPR